MPRPLSSSSSKIALYMPMQPSSKTPMIAFSRRSWAASASPSCFSALSGSSGSAWTCESSCSIVPVVTHDRIASWNQASLPSTVHTVE